MFFVHDETIDLPFWNFNNFLLSFFFAFITYFYTVKYPNVISVFFIKQQGILFRKQEAWFADQANINYLKHNIKNNESWFIVV
jgi:hypothetical protein